MSVDKDDIEQVAFIQELIDGGRLEGAALGIAKQVVAKGPDSLSGSQDAVLEATMREFSTELCESCGNPIPWSERYQAAKSGRCCGCIVK
jgi:hypothetical protein